MGMVKKYWDCPHKSIIIRVIDNNQLQIFYGCKVIPCKHGMISACNMKLLNVHKFIGVCKNVEKEVAK